MSAKLETAIQERVRQLSHEQQQQVMAFIEQFIKGFVEEFEPQLRDENARRFSFVGIAKSGNGLLSTDAESILGDAADRTEGWSLR